MTLFFYELYLSPQAGWASHFTSRSLKAYSISPLLVVPTHYTGEQGYISDTEESALLPVPKREMFFD